MDRLIQKLKRQNDWQSRFQDYNRRNNLANNPLNRLSESNIQILMKHISKISEQKHQKHTISWVSTQYQILEIVLNAISVLTKKNIEDFAPSEWTQVCNIFHYKEPLTIKYESMRMILEKKQHRRRWCASEENFLIEIVKKSLRKNKWNDVARQLYIQSGGRFFRQGKHCRDRWLNHLHPSIQNNLWTQDEDLKLLTFVLKRGKKWAKIAKKFCMTRSECMVKKRFYELINVEEQDAISSESLKSLIKKALDRLKADYKPTLVVLKTDNKNQQEVNNKQRKCSISKQTLKMEPMENLYERDIKPKLEEGYEEKIQQNTEKDKHQNSYLGISVFENIYAPHFNINPQTQNIFSSYQGYSGLLENQVNPLYAYYTQAMFPFQNQMLLNQTKEQFEKFFKF